MGKYVIIGGSGIGAAIARSLHAEGHQLHVIGRNAEATASLAAELGASHAIADVTDRAAMPLAIAAAGASIDGLCYAAGTINLKPFARLQEDEFRRDFDVNALSAARAVQWALPALKVAQQPPASILMFSSIAVAQGFTAHASIAMAKGAVEALVRSLAAELAPAIRVNAIAPSLTRTPLASPLTGNPALATTVASLHPLQRLGEPEDLATLGALLLTPKSGWITGQVFGVDGGRSSLRTKG